MKLYEYYAPEGVVTSGLVAEGPSFMLNNKELKILSGSFHYFRIHPDYWRETLKKLRATGLNTVETYVSWNLHEPRKGEFDFGQLGEDMSPFLDIRYFVEMAQKEDLLVIIRPGPYICSEWEFGGMPSWLMRDNTMHVRTYYEKFRVAAKSYLTNVLGQLSGLQFVEGGPIIAMQIENEYGAFGYDDDPRDKLYLSFLKSVMKANGFNNTLFFTSDNTIMHYDWGSVDGALQTANFNREPSKHLARLKEMQPNRPLMVAEFWSGWYDYWLAKSHTGWEVEEFGTSYEETLSMNASANLYMFIGGTNFGFLAGANHGGADYLPLVTSYDYDAPLTESGAYTPKYDKVKEILYRQNPLQGIVDNPPPPPDRLHEAYGKVAIIQVLTLAELVGQAPISYKSETGPLNMEALPMNKMSGQSYGYIFYSTKAVVAPTWSTLMIKGHVRDMAQVMVNGGMVTKPYGDGADLNSFGFWNGRDKTVTITGTGSETDINILVENLGRVNSGYPHKFMQKKGLWEGSVLIDREVVNNWKMIPLEFKQSFIKGLTGWAEFEGSLSLPAMYRATLIIKGSPHDTFLDMSSWGKGVVFVNGFNIGRYWSKGPTLTLYVPAPLLTVGENKVLVFEQYTAANVIISTDKPKLG
uniref:Beta-galactosidase n=1 Tax=Hirondellea gigas TaxID=1518452 RepID=A0A2P2I5I9_9CRUS